MTLKERIDSDIKNAMLSRERFLTDTLRGIKSVILAEEVARGQRDSGLDQTTTEALLAKEAKKRDEAAELFERGGNQPSADKERAEKEVIMQYLPAQLSEAQLKEAIDAAVASSGATSTKDMGRIIGAVKAQVGSSADSAVIARLVKEKLQH